MATVSGSIESMTVDATKKTIVFKTGDKYFPDTFAWFQWPLESFWGVDSYFLVADYYNGTCAPVAQVQYMASSQQYAVNVSSADVNVDYFVLAKTSVIKTWEDSRCSFAHQHGFL